MFDGKFEHKFEEFEHINQLSKEICHFNENHLFILGLQKKNYREIGLFDDSENEEIF